MDEKQESTETYIKQPTSEGVFIGIEVGLICFCIIMTMAMVAYKNRKIRVIGFMISFIVSIMSVIFSIYFMCNKF